ncbi:MAG: DUF1330 domain-containing protein [Caulobacterales bacterium]
MSAYMVVLLDVQNTDWVENYVANVPAIFRRYGGEYLAVSKRVETVEGDAKAPDQIAIFTFPSVDAIKQFLESADYAPYAKARIAASSANVFAIEA